MSNPIRVTLPVAADEHAALWDKVRDLHIRHNVGPADLIRRFSSCGLPIARIRSFVRRCREEAGLPAQVRGGSTSEFNSAAIRANPTLRADAGTRPRIHGN